MEVRVFKVVVIGYCIYNLEEWVVKTLRGDTREWRNVFKKGNVQCLSAFIDD